MLQWVYDPTQKLPKLYDAEVIVLTANLEIYHSIDLRNWIKITSEYFSIGSGQGFAIGALASGKTPEEAIDIASQYDTMTGLGVKSYYYP